MKFFHTKSHVLAGVREHPARGALLPGGAVHVNADDDLLHLQHARGLLGHARVRHRRRPQRPGRPHPQTRQQDPGALPEVIGWLGSNLVVCNDISLKLIYYLVVF